MIAFGPMVFLNEPGWFATTNARNTQVPGVTGEVVPLAAGTVAPLSVKLEAPGLAVTVPPEQVVLTLAFGATAMLGGRLSVRLTPVIGTVALFFTVTISSTGAPTLTGSVVPNILVTSGSGTTCRVDSPGSGLVTPWSVFTLLVGMVFR